MSDNGSEERREAADKEAAPAPAPAPIEADLNEIDFQGIHAIIDEEQGKNTKAATENTKAKRSAGGARSASRRAGKRSAARLSELPMDASGETSREIPKAPPGELPVELPPPEKENPPKEAAPMPSPPPPVYGVTDEGMEFIEVSLGTPKQFDQMFKPSNTYAGDQTMDDDEEEDAAAGAEIQKPSLLSRLRGRAPAEAPLTLEEAMKRANQNARSLRTRFLLSLFFLLPLAALTLLQTGSMLPDGLRYGNAPYVVIALMLLLHLAVIMLGLDLLAKGFMDLVYLRPGAETLLLFAAFATLLHSFTDVVPFAFFADSVGFLPYSAVSAASISFALWGKARLCKANARNYKTVLAGGETPDTVVLEEGVVDDKPGFSRLPQRVKDFHILSERPDVSMRVMSFLSPLLIIFSIVLALIADRNHPEGQFFTWSLAALANAAVPFTTFWVYSGFFGRLTARLSHMGAALAGWPAALEMCRGSSAILTDGDLFPPGSIAPNGKRVNSGASRQVTSFAASILEAAGSGLTRVFREMLADENGELRPVSNLQAGEGGLSGTVDGNSVLLGTLNYMFSEGMEMPKEGRLKNGVFIAINRQLAGIFVILYMPSAQVENALTLMDNQKINMMLATRDFNITPNLLKEKYHVDPDPVDYPDPDRRMYLSDPARQRRGIAAAVLSRDGLCPYAEAIVGGQRLRRITTINMALQLFSLFSTLFIVYYFSRSLAAGAAESIIPGNLLTFMFLWWLIQWLISLLGNRY